MLVRTFASAVIGIDAVTVTIEVNEYRVVQFFPIASPENVAMGSYNVVETVLFALSIH
jgi:magnesium chelatase family protein